MKSNSEDTNYLLERAEVIKLVGTVCLLPLLPLAIATNFLGAADSFSSFPGIKKGGGVMSGVIALVYLIVLFGVVTTIGAAAIGSDTPVNAGTESTPTPATISTSTPTPARTTQQSATQTPTVSPTPSDVELRENYEEARQKYLDVWSMIPKDHPSTPELLGTDVRENQDALWVVFDETDVFENASRMRDEWTTIANVYGHAIRNHTGVPPERMVAVGWNNTGPITYFRVETDNVRAYLDDDIDYNTFYNRFFRTVRATNDAERSIARDIAEYPPDDN